MPIQVWDYRAEYETEREEILSQQRAAVSTVGAEHVMPTRTAGAGVPAFVRSASASSRRRACISDQRRIGDHPMRS